MMFGRNGRSIRCVYHGSKYDVTGAVIDMPAEPLAAA
jgi:phthalate 4,5-dioxygenase oxygenase subunit